MRTVKWTVVVLALLAIPQIAATCRQAAPESRSVAAAPGGAASGPAVEGPEGSAEGVVLGHLKIRDKLVTVRKGPDGPLYTVSSEDGTVLAEGLSQSELSARFPEVGETVEKGLADDDALVIGLN